MSVFLFTTFDILSEGKFLNLNIQSYKKSFNTFYNSILQKYRNGNICKIYGGINHNVNSTPLTYDLRNLQGQFMGFHDLILTLNSTTHITALCVAIIFRRFLVIKTKCS